MIRNIEKGELLCQNGHLNLSCGKKNSQLSWNEGAETGLRRILSIKSPAYIGPIIWRDVSMRAQQLLRQKKVNESVLGRCELQKQTWECISSLFLRHGGCRQKHKWIKHSNKRDLT